jgi:serine/threonine-protein kinase HipA
VWLPGQTEPVVAGAVQADGAELVFAYGKSYLARPDAISLQPATTKHSIGLPLETGTQRPPKGLDAHGVIRDAAPDSWGQQVILRRRVGHGAKDTGDLPLLTYLLESGSNRIGALDVQARSDVYEARTTQGSLEELIEAGDRLARGLAFSPELDDALTYGSSVGGARPKALLTDGKQDLIAKFSVSTDTYPWIQAEALGMELARRCGVNAAPTRLIRAAGRDVLLVERFDRPQDGTRRHVLSALTLLGLHELAVRHTTYTELVDQIRLRFVNPEATLHELFRRIVVNIILGNTDDHARNHAAFWNGSQLELTPAFDICPQPRSTGEAFLAMAYGTGGERQARLATCARVAEMYGYTRAQARELIDGCVAIVRTEYRAACEDVGVTPAVRDRLWEREILNPSISYNDT